MTTHFLEALDEACRLEEEAEAAKAQYQASVIEAEQVASTARKEVEDVKAEVLEVTKKREATLCVEHDERTKERR